MPSSTVSFTLFNVLNTTNTSCRQQPNQTHDDAILDVVVVGAGLAGLAAAISISLSGHNVTVLESAKELLEVYNSAMPHTYRNHN